MERYEMNGALIMDGKDPNSMSDFYSHKGMKIDLQMYLTIDS